jgi:hypothetical protein
MTVRERRLAYVILTFIVLAGASFFGYQFYLVPMKAKTLQIAQLQGEVSKDLGTMKKILADKKRLDVLSKISLPYTPNTRADADIVRRTDVARGEYVARLTALLQQSGFAPGSILSIQDKKPVAGPTYAARPGVPKSKDRTIYTRLEFALDLKGDLASLVAWMELFYQQRLLHQIKNLTVTRPINPDRARPNELDIKVQIEALVLDTAEQRKTLEPATPVDLPPVLAPGREYARIAGKDIFFGPAPPSPREEIIRYVDVSPHLKLDGLMVDPDGKPTATLFDSYHNHHYDIRPRAAGDGFRVEVYFYVNGNKRSLGRDSKDIELVDEAGDVRARWTIVKFVPGGLVVKNAGQHYLLRSGRTLEEAQQDGPLRKSDLALYDLKEEKAKPAGAVKDKGGKDPEKEEKQ